MNTLTKLATQFANGEIDKTTYIETMFNECHTRLFDYAAYLGNTNIKKIEIEDGRVIMTSRERGLRFASSPLDQRLTPVETLNFRDYEKEEASMMENLMEDGFNFFDIGANIGWYSIHMAVARRNARVFSFEPLPKTFHSLQGNVALNTVPNIALHPFGFSDQEGAFPFYYYAQGSGNASGANLSGRDNVETVQCEVKTLDGFTASTGNRVDFIKCDVEGAELMVFRGGRQTLERDKPIVFSEILRKWSAKFHYDPNEIFALFRQLGYRAFSVHDGSLVSFGDMTQETIETNFFFLHGEKHHKQIRRFTSE